MRLSSRLPSRSEEWARQSIALKGSVVLGPAFSLGILGLILSVLVVRPLRAQAIGQGFELERAGQYDQAAAIYLARSEERRVGKEGRCRWGRWRGRQSGGQCDRGRAG